MFTIIWSCVAYYCVVYPKSYICISFNKHFYLSLPPNRVFSSPAGSNKEVVWVPRCEAVRLPDNVGYFIVLLVCSKMLRRRSSSRKELTPKQILSKFFDFLSSSIWALPVATFIEQKSTSKSKVIISKEPSISLWPCLWRSSTARIFRVFQRIPWPGYYPYRVFLWRRKHWAAQISGSHWNSFTTASKPPAEGKIDGLPMEI